METVSRWNETSIIGEDPRFLSIDERRFRVYYTYPAPNWDVSRMGMLELTYNESSRRLDVTAMRDKIQPTYPKHASAHKESHKNWSPFLFRGHPLLVQSINPLVVVNETENEEQDGEGSIITTAEVVSISKLTKRIKWPYGSLRGGTNCILVNNSFYLSFFHSKTHLDNSYMATYVMGAYTFSNSIPFQLLSISTYPSKIRSNTPISYSIHLTCCNPILCLSLLTHASAVMHPMFYTGQWSFQTMARIDYILFPTSLYMVDGDTDTLVVTAGMQDVRGVQFRINIFELLNSLDKVR